MNNGLDPGWYGNVYQNYGNQARNGAVTNTLNSTPLWFGNPDGSCAAFSVEKLILFIRSVRRYGGDQVHRHYLGRGHLLHLLGIAASAALMADWKVEDTCPDFQGVGFMGCMIYESGPGSGSRVAGNSAARHLRRLRTRPILPALVQTATARTASLRRRLAPRTVESRQATQIISRRAVIHVCRLKHRVLADQRA